MIDRSDIKAAKMLARSRFAPDFDETDSRLKSAAQTNTIIAVITIGTVGLVGTLIFAEVMGSLPDPDNAQLNNSSYGILEGFSGAMDLLPVVLIVLVASVVIGVVSRLRGGGGMA